MKSLRLRPPRQPRSRRIAGHAQLDHILDPYEHKQKPASGTACPSCGAVFHDGRWAWVPSSPGAPGELCPACRRIHDGFPAGIVMLRGAFAREHKAELVRAARHQEAIEKKEHPLNRIMDIEEDAEGLRITTTDIHLPRRIGESVKRAWRGELALDFEEDGYFVRVNWVRER